MHPAKNPKLIGKQFIQAMGGVKSSIFFNIKQLSLRGWGKISGFCLEPCWILDEVTKYLCTCNKHKQHLRMV